METKLAISLIIAFISLLAMVISIVSYVKINRANSENLSCYDEGYEWGLRGTRLPDCQVPKELSDNVYFIMGYFEGWNQKEKGR